METVLDPTYLRPGIITRATVIGLAALAVGVGVFLACFGLSYFWHYDSPVVSRLDDLSAKVETLVQRPDHTDAVIAKLNEIIAKPDRLDAVIAKLNDIGSTSKRDGEAIRGSIAQRLATIEQRIEELKKPSIIVSPPGPSRDDRGNVITKEVTVFHNVEHESGTVVTGWRYPDGASADQRPTNQYCYWSSGPLGGTSAQATIHIAVNGTRLTNIATGVPQLEAALQKCIWWSGVGQ
jgi:hypothetical protein